MAATRPYHLVFKGVTHIIEAPNAALAVHHIVGADISELRPARAAEVSAWIRGGQDIPVADGKRVEIAPAAPSPEISGATSGPENNWTEADAKAWLAKEPGGASRSPFHPLMCLASMRREGRMDLEDFDAMRVQVPTFGLAMLGLPPEQATSDADLARVRAALEDTPMPFEEVVRLLWAYEQQRVGDSDIGDRLVGQTGHLDT